ncbi:transketolase [Leptospira sp. GIMC2001]|uniref:transketolase n=1 Tax=Leptospira sp. GIMC2001 TaxID=1513297 RepID=UPI00234B34A4|nr:transketolase [Leptospira sp. GIMC2001]WCL51199.1 transketolase [Leptospira sp. GIMC2001]
MDNRSKHLRRLIVEMMEFEKRGHIGPALSLIEILRVLYDNILNFDSKNPNWEERDRLILSKGHGCLALYSILADKGYFPMEILKTFGKPDSILGGHPERDKVPGVEASTGALGHGLPIGVGMAIAAKIKNKNFRVFVITGDGEINEGSNWEAALSASKHRLSNLSLIIDYNKLQSYGKVSEVLELEPLVDKWRSFGFSTVEVDGHDVNQLKDLFLKLPLENDKPTAIIAHTVKGKGFASAEGNPKWHHKNKISPEEFSDMYKSLEI